MARKALVEILGNPRDFIQSLKSSSHAVDSFELDLKGLAVTAEKTAASNVKASLKRDARLRQEVIAYRNVARAAVKGSREQVTAANHAEAAERRLARSLGVTAHEQARLARSSGQTHQRLLQTARGAIAGSGAFRAMGRSIAFASGTFLGFAAAAQVIRSSISAASDLTEQVNKASVVFRGNKKAVLEWAHTLLPSFGLTRAEAIKTLGTFGNMLVPMGFARKAARQMSEQLVELSGDMASFNNASPVEVLQALQAGLSNQPRPLRRFGVFLTQARIAAEALSSGIVKANVDMGKVGNAQSKIAVAQARLSKLRKDYGANSTQAAVAEQQLFSAERELQTVLGGTVPKLTNAQRTMAIYRIVLKDTADAHGDAARTGKEWAGQMRSLHALAGDLEEEIGKVLMPTFLGYIRTLVTWLGKSKNQRSIVDGVKQAFGALSTAISTATAVTKGLLRVTDFLADHLGGWKTMLGGIAAAWIAWKTTAIAANAAVTVSTLVAAGVIKSALQGILIATGWGALAVAAGLAASYIITHWKQVKVFFQRLWVELQIKAARAFLKIVEPFSHLPGQLGGWARRAKEHMKLSLEGLKDDLGQIGTDAGNALGRNMYLATKKWAEATAQQRDIINLRAQQNQLKRLQEQLKKDNLVRKLGGTVYDAQGRKVEALSKKQRAQLEDEIRLTKKQIQVDREKVRMAVPDTDIADQPDKPHKPPPKPNLTDQGRLDKALTLPYRLQLEQAKADASGSAKLILQTAKDVRAYLLKLLPHLKGQKLLDAYSMLAQANQTIASAAKDAADKAKDDARKAREKLKAARDKMNQTIDSIRSQIGGLFEGPVFQPTAEQRKAALGVESANGQGMVADLKGQIALAKRREADFRSLQKAGASKELIAQLREQGIGALSQIDELTKADKKTQQEFFKLFAKKERLIQQIASTVIHTPKVHVHASRVDFSDAPQHGAGGGSKPHTTVVHTHVKIGDREIAHQVDKHQHRNAKRTAPQTRGRHPGTHA